MSIMLALALSPEPPTNFFVRWHFLDPLTLGIAAIGIAIPTLFTMFVSSLSRQGSRESHGSVYDRRTYLKELRLRYAAAAIKDLGRRQ